MCGIGGIFFFQQQQIPEAPLRALLNALAHRGPDDEGIFQGRQGVLCHRRLSIIDLSRNAAQPMKDESKRYAVMFNGEIYNFRQLRIALEKTYSFFSNSDTEVILRLFQEHQEKAWPLLNGMFSIAILDNVENELFLTRDHAGIKPLYYFYDQEKFVFASEPQALLATKLVSSEIDRKALSLYLQLGYFPAPFTPFKQIRKLQAGHAMKISSKGVETRQYWELPEIGSKHQQEKDLDPENELERLLIKSVERQMISDVPIGAFLSGGVDSSLIVALMREVGGTQVRTFTAGFEGMGYYDERPHASGIAKHFGTEHHEFAVNEPLETLVSGLAAVFGEPFADSSAVPAYCLAKLTSKHVKVALSGTGGDEIFGGYRKYMAAHWASAYVSLPDSLRSTIRKTVNMFPASRKSVWQERALLLQRFSDLSPQIPPNLQLNSIFTQDEASRLLGEESFPVNSLFCPIPFTIAENMMLFDYEVYLPEDLLLKEDRCTMAFGLEARVPYLDREIVEFMHRLPVRYKVSRTSTKKLFRKVAAKYLPASILRRPKHGFGSPVCEWLKNELKTLAENKILSGRFFSDYSLIRNKWDEHQNAGRDNSRALWAVLMLELWMDWVGETD